MAGLKEGISNLLGKASNSFASMKNRMDNLSPENKFIQGAVAAQEKAARAASAAGNVGKTVMVAGAGFGAGVVAAGSKSILPSTAYDGLFVIGLIANLIDYFIYGNSVNVVTIFMDTIIFLWIMIVLLRVDIRKVFFICIIIFLIFFTDTFTFLPGGLTQPIIYIFGIIGLYVYLSKFDDPWVAAVFGIFVMEVFSVKLAIIFPIIKPALGLFLANKFMVPLWSLFGLIKGGNESPSGFNTKMLLVYLIIVMLYAIPNITNITNWEASANNIITSEQEHNAQEQLKLTWEKTKAGVKYPIDLFSAYLECNAQWDGDCTKYNKLTKHNETNEYVAPTGQEIPIIPTTVKLSLEADGSVYPAKMVNTVGLPIEISINKGTDDFIIEGGIINCLFINASNPINTFTGEIDNIGGPTLIFDANEKEGNHLVTRLCKSAAVLNPGEYKLNVTFIFKQKAKSYLKMYFVPEGIPDVRGQKEKFPYYGKIMKSQMKKGLIEMDINSKSESPIPFYGDSVPVYLKLLFLNTGTGLLEKVESISVKTDPVSEQKVELNAPDLTVRIRESQKQSKIPTQDLPFLVTASSMFTNSNNAAEFKVTSEMVYYYSINKISRFKIAKEG